MSNRSVTVAGVIVALTDDTYSYNDTLYTLEVTNEEDGENDADVSGLETSASDQEVNVYLEAASAKVAELVGPDNAVRRVAAYAASAGMKAVIDLRLGNSRRPDVIEQPTQMSDKAAGIAAHRAWEEVRGNENECAAESRMREDESVQYSSEFWNGWLERSDEWRDEIGHDA